MIDIEEPLSWLNHESSSKLSSSTEYWTRRFNDVHLDPFERYEIVQALDNLQSGLSDPFEQAEVLTYCGVFYYHLAQLEKSIDSLTRANKLYEYLDDLHRHAVTTWMLHMVRRANGEFRKAFDEGRLARMHFQQKAEQYKQREEHATESWYQGRVLDITVFLIDAPEDSFEWMFEFRGTHLSNPATQIKDRLQDNLEKRSFLDVPSDMDSLLEITRHALEPEETGEAHAYCGVAEWLMEHRMSAIHCFRSALAYYTPNSHEYAILTWMLGLAQFEYPQMFAKAVVNLEKAITRFDQLREQAIKDHAPFQRDWYALHHAAMRRLLRTRIADQSFQQIPPSPGQGPEMPTSQV